MKNMMIYPRLVEGRRKMKRFFTQSISPYKSFKAGFFPRSSSSTWYHGPMFFDPNIIHTKDKNIAGQKRKGDDINDLSIDRVKKKRKLDNEDDEDVEEREKFGYADSTNILSSTKNILLNSSNYFLPSSTSSAYGSNDSASYYGTYYGTSGYPTLGYAFQNANLACSPSPSATLSPMNYGYLNSYFMNPSGGYGYHDNNSSISSTSANILGFVVEIKPCRRKGTGYSMQFPCALCRSPYKYNLRIRKSPLVGFNGQPSFNARSAHFQNQEIGNLKFVLVEKKKGLIRYIHSVTLHHKVKKISRSEQLIEIWFSGEKRLSENYYQIQISRIGNIIFTSLWFKIHSRKTEVENSFWNGVKSEEVSFSGESSEEGKKKKRMKKLNIKKGMIPKDLDEDKDDDEDEDDDEISENIEIVEKKLAKLIAKKKDLEGKKNIRLRTQLPRILVKRDRGSAKDMNKLPSNSPSSFQEEISIPLRTEQELF